MKCTLCPHHCTADRAETLGFCRAHREPEAATICIHKGEEPPLCGTKGICNVFFSHCNLQCIYCQNHQISSGSPTPRFIGVDTIVDEIARLLPQTENIVGFVTPSHYADSLPSIKTLQMLAPYIDIYLPDYKYSLPDLACRYSHAADYPDVALAALREMYNQKGSSLPTDEDGLAYRGIIVRHLVLPGQVENSLGVLDTLADISLNLHISLMAQYYPPLPNLPDQLGRTLTPDEYQQVVDHHNALGLSRGWVQELDAQANYRPDFTHQQAF